MYIILHHIACCGIIIFAMTQMRMLYNTKVDIAKNYRFQEIVSCLDVGSLDLINFFSIAQFNVLPLQ